MRLNETRKLYCASCGKPLYPDQEQCEEIGKFWWHRGCVKAEIERRFQQFKKTTDTPDDQMG